MLLLLARVLLLNRLRLLLRILTRISVCRLLARVTPAVILASGVLHRDGGLGRGKGRGWAGRRGRKKMVR